MTIGIKPLYHFTDTRNIPSIKEHGLLSFAELNRRGMANQVITGGDEQSLITDEKEGLDKYVHLCFFDQHNMEFKKRGDGLHARFLTINPIVSQWEGVKVTLGMANTRGIERLTWEQAVEEIDHRIICERSDWSSHEFQNAKNYEILVPNAIPVKFIIGGL